MTATVLKMTNDNIVNTHIFSLDSINQLKQHMKKIHVQSGDYLYYEGDVVDKLYYILEGSINLYKGTEDGKILTLNYFEACDMFGDYHSTGNRGAMENAKAIEDSIIGMIDRQDIEILLWKNRTFSIEFTKWISYSQMLTQTKLRDLMFFGKSGALASALIRITNTYGRKQSRQTWEITKKFTHDEISCLIGTPRETVTRMLNQLKKDGIIKYDKGYLTVINIEGLRQICRCEECPLQVCRL